MATTVDPVFVLLPIFDEARMKVTLCSLALLDSLLFPVWFPFLGNVEMCSLNCFICRKEKILESSGNWMRFYTWKDILDIDICCPLQRSVWKSFVKLKVDWKTWLHTHMEIVFLNPLLYIHNPSASHHSWRAWWSLAVQFPHSSSSLFCRGWIHEVLSPWWL